MPVLHWITRPTLVVAVIDVVTVVPLPISHPPTVWRRRCGRGGLLAHPISFGKVQHTPISLKLKLHFLCIDKPIHKSKIKRFQSKQFFDSSLHTNKTFVGWLFSLSQHCLHWELLLGWASCIQWSVNFNFQILSVRLKVLDIQFSGWRKMFEVCGDENFQKKYSSFISNKNYNVILSALKRVRFDLFLIPPVKSKHLAEKY